MIQDAASNRPLRVLIADDEPLGRRRIRDLLAREPEVEVVGEAGSGDEAVRGIRQLAPDLVFLDVQMPGRTGLDVVREIGDTQMPVTIFVTAYDHHAVEAFELAAVDYLVKPFDDSRFEQAFRRARRQVGLAGLERVGERVLTGLAGRSAAPEQRWLNRIAVESHGQARVIPTAEIEYITADGVYAQLHTRERKYLIRETMQTLEERLDPSRFLRIHRSAIVRVDLIDTLFRGGGGDYALKLSNGARLKVSRSRIASVEERIGARRRNATIAKGDDRQ